jgi:ribosomal protein S18 acetylase RimI-like enzyme
MRGVDSAGVIIRPAKPDEASAIACVHVQADRETYEPIFGEKFREVALALSVARWETAFVAGDVMLVVEDGGRIVGLAHASEHWMSALYLLATHHRRGIGQRLLSALCAALRARGVGEIGFQAVADNHNALGFYEAMGARQVGRKLEGEGDDAWEEVLLTLATDAPALARR